MVQAASSSNRIKTSLLTFSMVATGKAYPASGYETSLANLAQTGASAGTGQGSSLQMASSWRRNPFRCATARLPHFSLACALFHHLDVCVMLASSRISLS
ncbi:MULTISPECIES: hypothetical protein [unclassified Janthinobacterium]|uniref:hypothetical protein n=1 Tax=unclassified Janthinobacterium TaxID=2610881 RepID=UPI0016157EAE|nr:MULTISPECIES: hypothetical protein [unclassified Janthinobacterium]MBB5368526.1 hypothetical protein [Janthinobacterium sp. K2C7]MBB5381938.1 hypothetical protein [Janthinobacterium sp. K2Li3]MBB5386908.1 hypothetical protein [Janthinobacterium sp. K2E3]